MAKLHELTLRKQTKLEGDMLIPEDALRELDLEKAFSQVLAEERQGQDLAPDFVHLLDLESAKEQLIEELINELANGNFRNQKLIRIEVPKNNFCIRPAARPSLKDWVLYHAITHYLGIKADSKLLPCVYSMRFNLRTGTLEHGREQWKKFEQDFWSEFDKEPKHVVKTDITSYFANINLAELRKTLQALFEESDVCQTLINFLFDYLLFPWSREQVNEGFGIPQGINSSFVLGNLFLHHVDAALDKAEGVKYIRYADDIRILAKDGPKAKIALKTLDSELREHGLDINPAKTEIHSPEDARKRLWDQRSKDLDHIENMLRSKNKILVEKAAMPLLQHIFEESFTSNDPFWERHLKFVLYRFLRLRAHLSNNGTLINSITEKLLNRIEDLPGLAYWFAYFFSVYPSESARAMLIEFLRGEANIYEWQEMWILDALLRFPSFKPEDLELFKQIAFKKNKHPLCRGKAVLLLGKYGDNHQRYELTKKYYEETDFLVRRAILLGVQELPKAERNSFYGKVKVVDPDQNVTINFIKSRHKPIYFDDYVPPSIPIEENY